VAYQQKFSSNSQEVSAGIRKVRMSMLAAANLLASENLAATTVASKNLEAARAVDQAVLALVSIAPDRNVASRNTMKKVLEDLSKSLNSATKTSAHSDVLGFELVAYHEGRETDPGSFSGPVPRVPFAFPGSADFGDHLVQVMADCGFKPKPATFIQLTSCTAMFGLIWAQGIPVQQKAELIRNILSVDSLWNLLGGGDHSEARINSVAQKLAAV
jgi:hypothetical protein